MTRYFKCLLFFTLVGTSFASFATTNDFTDNSHQWVKLTTKGHSGNQQLLTVKDTPEDKIYLYWMSAGSTSAVKTHPTHEEVVITHGSLAWLNQNGSVQKTLTVGDYVDRKPNIPHGPFKAGKDGCMMFVRFHN